jgi:signal transduction histidine kinase
MERISLLLVEDNLLHLELTKVLLKDQMNVEIHVALSIREACEVLKSDSVIDAIVLDLELPDSRGKESYSRLKALRPELPVIVLSALDDDDLALSLVKEGVQDYLTKGQLRNHLLGRSIRYAIERKVILENLISSRLQLTRAVQIESLKRLASGAAHEVKNPLARLQLGLDYITRHLSDATDHMPRILESMTSAIAQADKVISSLVDYSNDKDREMVHRTLGAVIDEALDRVRGEILQNGVQLVRSTAADLCGLMCDRERLAQAIENVLINALQAMAGGGTLTVSTGWWVLDRIQQDQSSRVIRPLHAGDTVLKVTISDTGPGISPRHLDSAYDPFYTTRAAGAGAGLGLAVVRKVIDLHGGLIAITNRSEGGCRVRMTLPASAIASEKGSPRLVQ